MAENSLINIFNDCLEMLRRGETVETCLASYPEHRQELESLLRASVAVASVPVEPDSAYRAAAGLRFQGAVRHHLAQQQRGRSMANREGTAGGVRSWFGGFNSLSRAWASMAAAFIMMVGLTGGIAFASSDAMPDSPLYGIKRTVERARLAMIASDQGRALYQLELANRRLNEIAEMAKAGRTEKVENLASGLVQHIELAQAEAGVGSVMTSPPVAESAQPLAGAARAAPSSEDAGPAAVGITALDPSESGTKTLDQATAPSNLERIPVNVDARAADLLRAIDETYRNAIAYLKVTQAEVPDSAKEVLDRALEDINTRFANTTNEAVSLHQQILIVRGVVRVEDATAWLGDRPLTFKDSTDDRSPRFRSGVLVEVGGILQKDGSLLVVRSKTLERDDSTANVRAIQVQGPVLAVGANDGRGLRIPGYQVQITDQTTLRGQLQPGHWVRIDGRVTGTNTLLATSIVALNGAPVSFDD